MKLFSYLEAKYTEGTLANSAQTVDFNLSLQGQTQACQRLIEFIRGLHRKMSYPKLIMGWLLVKFGLMTAPLDAREQIQRMAANKEQPNQVSTQ